MKGFTLLEVLLAIVVFSLIAAVTASALGPAGEGFAMLRTQRARLEQQQWLGKQIRRDVNYLSTSEDQSRPVVLLNNDSRGEDAFDELQLLVRDPMYPGLMLVRYHIDEDTHHLKREVISPWARVHAEPVGWELAEIDSFNVEVFDAKSGWKTVWNPKPPFFKPQRIRVTIRDALGKMQWDLPVLQ